MNPADRIFNLNCFRFLFCLLYGFFYFFYNLPTHKAFLPVFELASNQLDLVIPLYIYQFFNSQVGHLLVMDCWDSLVACSLMIAAFGFKSQSFTIFALLLFTFWEVIFTTNTGLFSTPPPFFALLVLALCPAAHEYSFRQLFRGPAESKARESGGYTAISWILPIAFLNAFASKTVNGGDSWFNGQAFQSYMLFGHLVLNNRETIFIAQQNYLCIALGAIAMLIEGSMILLRAFSRTKFLCLVVGLSFHLGVLWILNLDFITSFGFIYLIYIDYAAIFKRLSGDLN